MSRNKARENVAKNNPLAGTLFEDESDSAESQSVPQSAAFHRRFAQKAKDKAGSLVKVNESNEIVIGKFRFTPVGAVWDGEPTKDDWKLAIDLAFRIESGIQWIIGDLLAFGEGVGYGDATAIAEELNRAPKTLHNWADVARSYPETSYRQEVLSFTHHQIISGREDRLEILEYAAKNELSVAAMKKYCEVIDGSEVHDKVYSREYFSRLIDKEERQAKRLIEQDGVPAQWLIEHYRQLASRLEQYAQSAD